MNSSMLKEQKQFIDLLKKQNPDMPEIAMLNVQKLLEVTHDFYVNSMVKSSRKPIRELYQRQLKSMGKSLFAVFNEDKLDMLKLPELSGLNTENLPESFERFAIFSKYEKTRNEMFTQNSNFDISGTIYFFSKLNNGNCELKFAKKIVDKIWQMPIYRVILPKEFLSQFFTGDVEYQVQCVIDGGESLIPGDDFVKTEVQRALRALIGLIDLNTVGETPQIYSSNFKVQKESRSINLLV